METHEVTLEHRVSQLERHNRQLRMVVLAMLLLALSLGATGLVGAGQPAPKPDASIPRVAKFDEITAGRVNIAGPDGRAFPQLGSVALQAGHSAAENILHDVNGEPMQPFRYHDKGIMAMIGHNAAVAEMGEHRHELHGAVGYAAWLGVHAYLMSGTRQRADAFINWAWDEFGKSRVLNTSDEARLHWEGDTDA